MFIKQYPKFKNWQNVEQHDCEYSKYVQIRLRLREYMLKNPIDQMDLEKLFS